MLLVTAGAFFIADAQLGWRFAVPDERGAHFLFEAPDAPTVSFDQHHVEWLTVEEVTAAQEYVGGDDWRAGLAVLVDARSREAFGVSDRGAP
jgi:hypothetical protein